MVHSSIFQPLIPSPQCYNYNNPLDGIGKELTCISCIQFPQPEVNNATCAYVTPFKISNLNTTITLNQTLQSMLGYSKQNTEVLPRHKVNQLFTAMLTKFPEKCINEETKKSYNFTFYYAFRDRDKNGHPDRNEYILPSKQEVFKTSTVFSNFYPFSDQLTIRAAFYKASESSSIKPDTFSKLNYLPTCHLRESQRNAINNCLKANPLEGIIIGVNDFNDKLTNGIIARGEPYASLRDRVVEYLNKCECRSVLSRDDVVKELSFLQWVGVIACIAIPKLLQDLVKHYDISRIF